MAFLYDIPRTHQLIGMLLISFIPFFFTRRIGILPALFWWYCLISSVLVWQSPWADSPIQFRLDASSPQGYAIALALPIFIFLLDEFCFENQNRPLDLIIFCGFFIESLLVIFHGYGFLNANSFSTGVIAATTPYGMSIWKRNKKAMSVYLITGLIAIIMAKGATGIIVLAAGLFTYAMFSRYKLEKVTLALIVMGIGFMTQADQLFSPGGRYVAWKSFMGWWWEHANHWIGTGVGTFEWYGPWIGSNFPNEIFLWMHNEFLQLLFEGGYIGYVLGMIMLAVALVRSWKRPGLFATLISFSVCCLTQFPFRFLFSAFTALVFLLYALDNKKRGST
jgi:hypothetical protein